MENNQNDSSLTLQEENQEDDKPTKHNAEYIASALENQPDKSIVSRKIQFDRETLRMLQLMSSFYKFDESLKKDDSLALMIKEATQYFFETRFLKDMNEWQKSLKK